MAKSVSPRKRRGGKAAAGSPDAKDRLLDAALSLAARQGWRRTGLAEIAAEAGLSLAEAHAACASKLGLLALFHRRIDQAALAGGAATTDEPPRDRLFDVLMRRFEALQPHRAALKAILRDSRGDPAALLGLPMLANSMTWMLEAAGVGGGWRGRLHAQLLTALYISVLRIFLDDESADLATTMAALDSRLRRAEAWLGLTTAPRGS
jgi:AcrR family transcriptional regulator